MWYHHYTSITWIFHSQIEVFITCSGLDATACIFYHYSLLFAMYHYSQFKTICCSLCGFSRHRHLNCISGQRYLKLDEINIKIESGTGENIKLASNHFKSIACIKRTTYILCMTKVCSPERCKQGFFGNFYKLEGHVLVKCTVKIPITKEHKIVWLTLGDYSVF